jgi:hypothetical protein
MGLRYRQLPVSYYGKRDLFFFYSIGSLASRRYSQPLDAFTSRSNSSGISIEHSLSDSDLDAAKSTAIGKDVAFVFISSDSGEQYIIVNGWFHEPLILNYF